MTSLNLNEYSDAVQEGYKLEPLWYPTGGYKIDPPENDSFFQLASTSGSAHDLIAAWTKNGKVILYYLNGVIHETLSLPGFDTSSPHPHSSIQFQGSNPHCLVLSNTKQIAIINIQSNKESQYFTLPQPFAHITLLESTDIIVFLAHHYNKTNPTILIYTNSSDLILFQMPFPTSSPSTCHIVPIPLSSSPFLLHQTGPNTLDSFHPVVRKLLASWGFMVIDLLRPSAFSSEQIVPAEEEKPQEETCLLPTAPIDTEESAGQEKELLVTAESTEATLENQQEVNPVLPQKTRITPDLHSLEAPIPANQEGNQSMVILITDAASDTKLIEGQTMEVPITAETSDVKPVEGLPLEDVPEKIIEAIETTEEGSDLKPCELKQEDVIAPPPTSEEEQPILAIETSSTELKRARRGKKSKVEQNDQRETSEGRVEEEEEVKEIIAVRSLRNRNVSYVVLPSKSPSKRKLKVDLAASTQHCTPSDGDRFQISPSNASISAPSRMEDAVITTSDSHEVISSVEVIASDEQNIPVMSDSIDNELLSLIIAPSNEIPLSSEVISSPTSDNLEIIQPPSCDGQLLEEPMIDDEILPESMGMDEADPVPEFPELPKQDSDKDDEPPKLNEETFLSELSLSEREELEECLDVDYISLWQKELAYPQPTMFPKLPASSGEESVTEGEDIPASQSPSSRFKGNPMILQCMQEKLQKEFPPELPSLADCLEHVISQCQQMDERLQPSCSMDENDGKKKAKSTKPKKKPLTSDALAKLMKSSSPLMWLQYLKQGPHTYDLSNSKRTYQSLCMSMQLNLLKKSEKAKKEKKGKKSSKRYSITADIPMTHEAEIEEHSMLQLLNKDTVGKNTQLITYKMGYEMYLRHKTRSRNRRKRLFRGCKVKRAKAFDDNASLSSLATFGPLHLEDSGILHPSFALKQVYGMNTKRFSAEERKVDMFDSRLLRCLRLTRTPEQSFNFFPDIVKETTAPRMLAWISEFAPCRDRVLATVVPKRKHNHVRVASSAEDTDAHLPEDDECNVNISSSSTYRRLHDGESVDIDTMDKKKRKQVIAREQMQRKRCLSGLVARLQSKRHKLHRYYYPLFAHHQDKNLRYDMDYPTLLPRLEVLRDAQIRAQTRRRQKINIHKDILSRIRSDRLERLERRKRGSAGTEEGRSCQDNYRETRERTTETHNRFELSSNHIRDINKKIGQHKIIATVRDGKPQLSSMKTSPTSQPQHSTGQRNRDSSNDDPLRQEGTTIVSLTLISFSCYERIRVEVSEALNMEDRFQSAFVSLEERDQLNLLLHFDRKIIHLKKEKFHEVVSELDDFERDKDWNVRFIYPRTTERGDRIVRFTHIGPMRLLSASHFFVSSITEGVLRETCLQHILVEEYSYNWDIGTSKDSKEVMEREMSSQNATTAGHDNSSIVQKGNRRDKETELILRKAVSDQLQHPTRMLALLPVKVFGSITGDITTMGKHFFASSVPMDPRRKLMLFLSSNGPAVLLHNTLRHLPILSKNPCSGVRHMHENATEPFVLRPPHQLLANAKDTHELRKMLSHPLSHTSSAFYREGVTFEQHHWPSLSPESFPTVDAGKEQRILFIAPARVRSHFLNKLGRINAPSNKSAAAIELNTSPLTTRVVKEYTQLGERLFIDEVEEWKSVLSLTKGTPDTNPYLSMELQNAIALLSRVSKMFQKETQLEECTSQAKEKFVSEQKEERKEGTKEVRKVTGQSDIKEETVSEQRAVRQLEEHLDELKDFLKALDEHKGRMRTLPTYVSSQRILDLSAKFEEFIKDGYSLWMRLPRRLTNLHEDITESFYEVKKTLEGWVRIKESASNVSGVDSRKEYFASNLFESIKTSSAVNSIEHYMRNISP